MMIDTIKELHPSLKILFALFIFGATCFVAWLTRGLFDPKVTIDQRVEVSSYVDQTYRVSTTIWLRRPTLSPRNSTIEGSEYAFSVRAEDIDEVLRRQEILIRPKFEKVKKFVEEEELSSRGFERELKWR